MNVPQSSSHRQATADLLRKSSHPLLALVVDDDPGMADYLADTLDDLGYQVITASNVGEAVAAAQQHENLTVAFVDLGLPDRSGLELLAELHKLQQHLPIVLATGYAAMARRDAIDENNHMTVMAKPFDIKAITKALSHFGLRAEL
ncbi:MAG: response regulator [Steroidobacteraceae bacterium]